MKPPDLSAAPALLCPNCGGAETKNVTFTWWGGALGPKILHHVECAKCGAGYNSRTGKSNATGIAIYVAVMTIVFGLLAWKFMPGILRAF